MLTIKESLRFLQSKTPGARTLKTGIAVSISMFLCQMLSIPSPVLAGAATVSNMQPGTGESIKNAKDQAKAHIIAVLTAIAFGVLFGPAPLVIGAATVVIITICLALKIEKSIHVAIIAAIFIMYSPEHNYIYSALQRSAAIFVGIVVAFIVNVSVLPPENEKKLKLEIAELHKMLADFFSEALNDYLFLKDPEKSVITHKNTEIEEKTEKAKNTLKIFESELDMDVSGKEEKEKFYEDYLVYLQGLHKHIKDIYFLNESRRNRILTSETDLLEQHFSEINCFVVQLFSDFQKYNDLALKKVKEEPFEIPAEKEILATFNTIIMEQFDVIEDKRNFISTVVEVAIIVYKLRWSIEEAKKIMNK